MYNQIKEELSKAYDYISRKNLFNWYIQNNIDDNKSNFIYCTYDFENLLKQIKYYELDESYIIHRWYNFHTSKVCESIFCTLGAIKEKIRKINISIFTLIKYHLI